jgi:5-methylcytosine-specific restriction endonuclease McrA
MPRRVLVLNQDYSPITVCTVQRAFLLVFLNKAELLETATSHMLRTVSCAYPMPSVIRIFKYIRVPYKSVVLTRNNIFKRDNFTCQYCDAQTNLTLDHLIPVSKGGKSSWTNLVTACRPCNARKGHFTPEQVGMKLKRKPYKPSFLMFLKDFSSFTYQEWKPFLQQYRYEGNMF